MANEICSIIKAADDYSPLAALGYVAYGLYNTIYIQKQPLYYENFVLALAIAGGALYLAHNTLQPLEKKVC